MQTFLPYADFVRSAKTLDMKRLGKQRVEAYSIIRINRGIVDGGAWKRHPAVKMWRGYEDALCVYLQSMIDEWTSRGYRNTIIVPEHCDAPVMPPWLGRVEVHRSHRSNLLRKNPDWYAQFGWSVRDDLDYVWPKESQAQIA